MVTWSASDTVESLGDGRTRFHNPLTEHTPPFPAYAQPPSGTPITPPDAPPSDATPKDPVEALAVPRRPVHDPVPEFARFGDRSLVRVTAANGCDRYGWGEVCGSLRHDNRRITGSTADSFAYDDRHDHLYQAHPWGLCVRGDGSAFGIVVETTWRFTTHLYEHVLVEVDGPPPAVTIIEGAGALEVLEGLAELCGTMALPPRWALGYQQSRWNYAPATQVRDVAAEFRARELPADVIWIDIDYMDAYKVFTVDPDFGDARELNDELHDLGWRSAWMIDPGLKIEEGYSVYDEAVAGDHLLGDAGGTPYPGIVWPGPTVWPDFTRQATRRWWAGLYEDFLDLGVDAVWNDMNEPANLENVPDKALPADLVHRADDELGGPGSHARYRNVYGMLMTQASRQGMLDARPDARPFLLTRSTFLGGHRYAATWTGDNVSSWEHLAWSIPMALNLGLSGQPFVGPDIGGFVGRCTGPLLARWMGIGCLLPFARNHTMKTMPEQEPWVFGAQVEATCRRALERRYRLLPYLYTCFEDAARTGRPVVRPAFLADPSDRSLRTVDTAFLLGDDLYVRADVSPTGTGPTAPVPTGWRRVLLLDDDADRDPELPELYLRPGAVLPLGPVMQWSDERPVDHLDLVAHLDAGGTATTTLYEDDGDGFAYADGAFRRTALRVTADADAPAVETERLEGEWPAPPWTAAVRLVP